jgi:Ni,Fe-hydrogenase III component G
VSQDLATFTAELKKAAHWPGLEWHEAKPNRIYLDVPLEHVPLAAAVLYETLDMRFATITGMDIGERLELLYHFCYDPAGLIVTLRASTPKSEAMAPSITPLVPPAEWIERELYDLLGVTFEGHPRPERLILADDWPDGVHPLRKDVHHDA